MLTSWRTHDPASQDPDHHRRHLVGGPCRGSVGDRPPRRRSPIRRPHRKLDGNVLMPFQIAVRNGTIWYADGAAGTITELRNGRKTVVVTGGAEGVAVSGKKLAYTKTPRATASQRLGRPPAGASATMIVNLRSLRAHPQPGRATCTYGIIRQLQPVCGQTSSTASSPAAPATPASRTRTPTRSRRFPVVPGRSPRRRATRSCGSASAAGSPSIALLPRQPITITQKMADAMDAPDCVVASGTPSSRCRPTSSVTGTATSGSRCSPVVRRTRASVPAVRSTRSPRAARCRRIHGGFLGATNLAVTPGGKVYVAELFKNRISTLRNGRVVNVRSIDRARSRSR